MTESKRVFVLVGDEQTPLSPSDVAGMVMSGNFKKASEKTGFSESTLRKFLSENGIHAKRSVVYEKTPESVAITSDSVTVSQEEASAMSTPTI